jgi:hypothetical protein
MSLINDALKKAQRQRTNNPFGIDAPMPGGGGRRAKRGSPMPAQNILLIVAGCAVLVVLSAVGAIFFVNGKSDSPKPAAITASVAPIVPVAAETNLPALEIPALSLPAKSDPPVAAISTPAGPALPPAETKVEPIPPSPVAAAKAASEPSITAASAAPRPGVPDERVHAYLDALRVTGVRTSGASSRVLLNEKVYRLNETVDRNLALKLTGVETDFLTFTGANGMEYRKNF